MRQIPSPLRTLLPLLAVLSLTASASALASDRTADVTVYNSYATGKAGPPAKIAGCERRAFVAATATSAPGSYSSGSTESLVETLRSKARRAGANTLVVAYADFAPLADEGDRLRGVAFSCPAGTKVPGKVLPAHF